jgi:hypothetical protein
MECKKIAFFCWESLYTDRVGGLASAATYLAHELSKRNEVHYFTRGDRDFTFGGVHYHGVRPSGSNVVDYCRNMSYLMVEKFKELDKPRFDVLHFMTGMLLRLSIFCRIVIQYSPTTRLNMEETETSMETGGSIRRSQEKNGMQV